MKTAYLIGIIASLALISAGTFVYAHGADYLNYENGNDHNYMDDMHNSMIQYFDNSEIKDYMNKMHESIWNNNHRDMTNRYGMC